MYKVKPYEEKTIITCIPSCVYKTKCYFNPDELKLDDEVVAPMAKLSLSELENLTNQQDKQFRRLERLVKSSNELCDYLKLPHLVIQDLKMHNTETNKMEYLFKKQQTLFQKIEQLNDKVKKTCEQMGLKDIVTDFDKMTINSSQTKNKTTRKPFKPDLALFNKIKRVSSKVIDRNVEDIVIYADPSAIPVELLNFFDLLSQNIKAFVKFYIHSSISNQLNEELENKVLNIQDLFEELSLGINNKRVDYDLGLTFIWRKSNANLNLVIHYLILTKWNQMILN